MNKALGEQFESWDILEMKIMMIWRLGILRRPGDNEAWETEEAVAAGGQKNLLKVVPRAAVDSFRQLKIALGPLYLN